MGALGILTDSIGVPAETLVFQYRLGWPHTAQGHTAHNDRNKAC